MTIPPAAATPSRLFSTPSRTADAICSERMRYRVRSVAMPFPPNRSCEVYGLPAGGVPRTTVSLPLPMADSTSSVGSSGTGFATKPRTAPMFFASAITVSSGPSPSKRSVTY